MTKPVYRHLAEQKWKNDGDLDLLVSGTSSTRRTHSNLVQMERIHQMNVVPDVLPSMHPSFDLRLTFPEPPPQSVYLRTRSKRKHKQVEPGIFLVSEQVLQCNIFSLFSLGCSLTSRHVDPKATNTLRQRFPSGHQTLHSLDGGPRYVFPQRPCTKIQPLSRCARLRKPELHDIPSLAPVSVCCTDTYLTID